MNWPIIFVFASAIVLWPDYGTNSTPFGKAVEDNTGTAASNQHASLAPYFEGHGLSPTWKLEIFSDSISFHSEIPGFESFRAAHREPVKDMNRKSYDCPLAEGKLLILIDQQSCAIEGSNESFGYSLQVDIVQKGADSTERFEGCGHYITSAELDGRWILEQMLDQQVTGESFSGLIPFIEIAPRQNSFDGFTGCNKINGRIFSERSLLRFTDIVSTKMSCEHLAKEDEFLEALRFSTQFVVDGDQLILSNPLNTTLILRKKK